MTTRGIPRTLEELTSAVDCAADAYFVGWIWARWLSNGLPAEALSARGLTLADPDQKLVGTHALDQQRLGVELEQFLIRAIVREWGGLTESYLQQSGLLAAHGNHWSRLPDPIYVLRILRRSLTHDWTVGRVERDVSWESGPYALRFYANKESAHPPAGYRAQDDIVPLIRQLPGDGIRDFMMDDVDKALHRLAQLPARDARGDQPGPAGVSSERHQPSRWSERAPDSGRRAEPTMVHPAAVLVQSWLDGDKDEQQSTLEFLKRALDEDRLSDRPRFRG